MDSDAAPPDAFSRFFNVSTPVLTNISSCYWMSMTFEDLGTVWISENETKYFGIKTYSNGRYSRIGKVEERVEFPKDFFVPDKWFLFCFTYNNIDKNKEVYLNL